MSAEVLRALKVKTGVVKRIHKEWLMYQVEADKQQVRIDKMRANDADEYDIKKQIEVLNESKMMIPDCKKRLEVAQADLSSIVNNEKGLEQTEEYKAAVAILQDTAN
eukprot:Opistho-2@79198